MEQAEARVGELEQRLADPDIYARAGGAEVPGLMAELERARADAKVVMKRWEDLEEKREQDS